MPRPEQGPQPHPNELPPDLAEFLRDQEWACLTEATDQGMAYILKLPRAEIESVRGRVPIGLAKQVPNSSKDAIPLILEQAQRHLASLPADLVDFDTAKAEVIEAINWLPPLWGQPQPGRDLP